MTLGAAKLARIHRVRTLQLNLKRGDEVRAAERVANESALSSRIAQLAANVAPQATGTAGVSLTAAAYYRDRLQQSALAAQDRVRSAELLADHAAEATRSARRDQSAIEKLIARADADAALKAIRALEDSPPSRKNRHDPC